MYDSIRPCTIPITGDRLFLWKIKTELPKKLRNFQYWLKSSKLDQQFLFVFTTHFETSGLRNLHELFCTISVLETKKFSTLQTFKKFSYKTKRAQLAQPLRDHPSHFAPCKTICKKCIGLIHIRDLNESNTELKKLYPSIRCCTLFIIFRTSE